MHMHILKKKKKAKQTHQGHILEQTFQHLQKPTSKIQK